MSSSPIVPSLPVLVQAIDMQWPETDKWGQCPSIPVLTETLPMGVASFSLCGAQGTEIPVWRVHLGEKVPRLRTGQVSQNGQVLPVLTRCSFQTLP